MPHCLFNGVGMVQSASLTKCGGHDVDATCAGITIGSTIETVGGCPVLVVVPKLMEGTLVPPFMTLPFRTLP
jgi:hypothetical protein